MVEQPMLRRRFGRYTIGVAPRYADTSSQELVQKLSLPTSSNPSTLGGRASVCSCSLAGIGPVVVKHYNRGGFLGMLVRNAHLAHGLSRAEVEFMMLHKVRALGVRAPEAVACLERGMLIRSSWLVTREIQQQCSLAELSLTDEDHAAEAMQQVIEQVSLLMQNRILHIDLHPGNVLVDRAGCVYLLDFDKAQVSDLSSAKLRDHYLFRWRRAAIKHRLPDLLSERMSLGLLTKVGV